MREILFRGKTHKGNWVSGAYYHQTEFYGDACDEHYIIETCDELEDNMMVFSKVIAETIGQYTGLTDKNGKKIFEGDIVKRCGDKCVVKWTKEDAKFIIIGGMTKLDFSLFFAEQLEVIGNIHENQ